MNVCRRMLPVVAVILSLAPGWMSAADDENAEVVAEATDDEQSAVARSSGSARFGAYDVRENVDSQDAVERFVLLLPGAPLIVETALTKDGEPFRARREALIDEMLAAGDRDEDGIVTWEEALGTTGFTYGRILPEQQRTRYIEMLDSDNNGEVNRAEARGFLAVLFQGPAFRVTNALANRGRGDIVFAARGQVRGGRGQADVTALLDEDSDGVLSETEIARAGDRLKSRDADGNDLLYTHEIGGNVYSGNGNVGVNVNGQGQQTAQVQAVLLGPAANPETLFTAIRTRYLSSARRIPRDSFVGMHNPFNQLDADGNGTLSMQEAMRLNDVEPHVRLTVDLGRGGGESTLTLTYLEGGEKSPEETDSTAGIELPGVSVAFAVSTDPIRNFNYETTAQRMLDQYDNDNNEYLELSEMPVNFGPQFEAWDGDSDGKVFPQDIVDGYTRSQRPQQTQIQADIVRSGDPLFPALDLSGDSRLSLREMRTAHEQLAALDDDGDGQLTQVEVPVSFAVTFRIGNGGYGSTQALSAVRGGVQPASAPTGDGPQWFLRMDRNGDGDVTLREFLGDRKAFEELDTNSDGFIEPAEAEAASEDEGQAD